MPTQGRYGKNWIRTTLRQVHFMTIVPLFTRAIRFEGFTLDLRRRRLSRAGKRVPLSALPFQILDILVAAEGAVVTRAEFKQRLWPQTSRIDTERRLNTAMRALREALGEDAEQPRYIETLRGHGYRWIAKELDGTPYGRPYPAWAAAAALVLMVGGSVGATGGFAPSSESDAQFARVAIAAESNDAAGARALAGFIGRHPQHAAARVLNARIATDGWNAAPAPGTFEKAQEAVDAARRTVGDDPRLVTWAADLTLGGDWNWARAEELYRQAASADNDGSARRGLAWLYVNQGRNEEAVAEVGRMLAAEPLTPDLRANLGWLLIRAERPDLAANLCRGDRQHLNLLACRHTALAETGAMIEARQAALDLMDLLGAAPSAMAAVRDVPSAQGYRVFLSWRVDHFPTGPNQWFHRAQLQAEAGRMDEALSALERAVAVRDPLAVKLGSTRAFAPLRRNPRFQVLLNRIGLPNQS